MFRKIQAVILLWLMTLAVATSQPGLRYCLCLHDFYLNDCACALLYDDEFCQVTARFPGESLKVLSSAESENVSPLKCLPEDCSIGLSFDESNYISNELISVPKLPEQSEASQVVANIDVMNPLRLRSVIHGIRGSPQFAGLIPSLPHRLRFSVFLV